MALKTEVNTPVVLCCVKSIEPTEKKCGPFVPETPGGLLPVPHSSLPLSPLVPINVRPAIFHRAAGAALAGDGNAGHR